MRGEKGMRRKEVTREVKVCGWKGVDVCSLVREILGDDCGCSVSVGVLRCVCVRVVMSVSGEVGGVLMCMIKLTEL